MTGLAQDFRVACRALRRRPGFTTLAVITLTLGIGANTTIFSVFDAAILRPLPFRSPERLVILRGANRNTGNVDQPASFDEFREWSAASRSFEGMAALSPLWKFTLSGDPEPEEIEGQYVSPGFFELLGAAPALGRTITPAEHASAAPVAVIGDGLWRRRFGARPDAIGRVLVLDGEPVTIVGVARPRFEFLEPAGIWVPIERNPFSRSRRYVRMLSVAGRLRAGVSLAAASTEMDAIAGRIAKRFPETNAGVGITLVGLRDALLGKVRPAIRTLLGAVGLVLLIACANVASLVLARASERRREIAIRAALGASRFRRTRLALVECLLLSFAGASGGLLASLVALPVLLAWSPFSLPAYAVPRLSGTILAFDAAAAVATCILFALLGSRDPAVAGSLHDAGRSATAARASRRGRNILIAGEIALALVLLAGAGLLLRSVSRLVSVDPGFSPEGVLAFSTGLPGARYAEPARRTAFARELEARIASLPHVAGVGRVTRLPFMTSAKNITTFLAIEGRPTPPAMRPEIDFRRASTAYFATMKIPLRRGRITTESDVAAGNRVVVVNETFARRFFPGQDPIGRRISTATAAGEGDWQTIVGVVGNVRHAGLDQEPRPEVYYHADTSPPSGPVFVVRANTDPRSLFPAIRAAVAGLDRDVPVANLATLDELVAQSVSPRKAALFLLGAFAFLALTLAAAGVYGVISFATARRTREIGIRMAMGATRASIIRMVLGQGGRPIGAGIAIGIAAAAAATRLLSGMLFAVAPIDPATFLSVAILLACAGMLAALIPARRASRIDPLSALREE